MSNELTSMSVEIRGLVFLGDFALFWYKLTKRTYKRIFVCMGCGLILRKLVKNQPLTVMMRTLSMVFFFAACYLTSSVSYAQQWRWSGVVINETNEAVPGAILSILPGEKKVRTDLDGKFTVELDAGNYTYTASFTGYPDAKGEFELKADVFTTIRMEMNSAQLNIVVVSAGKFEQEVGEVTVSMEVLKPRLLEERNTTSIDDVLQQTPGVSIVDGEPQIRSGSGYSFGAGSRVQVLIDDLPMLSGDAGKPSWDFLPIENLSQVEVIKGASSVLYGSSALSGVINMRTAFPGETPETQVTAFHGVFSAPQSDSAKYWSGNLMRSGVNFLHKRKIGQLDFVIGGFFLGDDGHLGPIRDTATGAFDNKYNPFTADRYEADTRGRMNMNLRYRFKNVDGLSIGLNTNVSKSNSLGTFIWDNNRTGLYDAYAGSATRTKQLLSTVDPYIVYAGKRGAKHSWRTRWQSLDNENDNNQGNFSDVIYSEYQYQQNWESFGVKGLNTTAGVLTMTTTSRGELYIGGNADGVNHALNQAAFFQVDKKWGKRLNTSAGVRYERFVINGEKEGKPVYRFGANYKVHKATYIRASYGQGYRFPSIAEKFIVTALGALQIYANPDLQSETSYNAEVGIKQGFKFGRFMGFIDVAAFQQEFDNYIEFTFGQWATPTLNNLFGFGFKSINTGSSKVTGAELSIMGEGKIGNVLIQTLGGYTYAMPVSTSPDFVYARSQNFGNSPINYLTTSSDTTGNILKYRMVHLVRFDIQGTYKKIALGMSYRYNSHMMNIDNAFEFLEENLPGEFNPGIREWRANNSRGDMVYDARISYQINKHHKFAIIMNNVLNREYAIRPLSIEAPRLTTIQYTFNW